MKRFAILCVACVSFVLCADAFAWNGVRVRQPLLRPRVVVQRQVLAAPVVVQPFVAVQPFVLRQRFVAPLVVPHVQRFVVPQAFAAPGCNNGCFNSGVSASLFFSN